jgi:AcrR family transcriptional regulator
MAKSQRPQKNRWLREPKQERTRARLETIFEAAERLFDAQGFENTTLRQVAAEAPCSMSAIYARFASKDDLLLAMHERLRQRVLSGMPLLVPPDGRARMTLERWVRLAVEGGCSAMTSHRGLRRAVMERCISSPALAAKEKRYREELCEQFVRGLSMYTTDIAHPDPEAAARRIYSTLTAVISVRYDMQLEPEKGRLSDARFMQECTRMCLGYLAFAD